jgi:hypothetical protein
MTYGWAKGSDRRWRKLRARKLTDEPRCELCLAWKIHEELAGADQAVEIV